MRWTPTYPLAVLVTFLWTASGTLPAAEPPRMPEYGKEQPPPPRTRAEVNAVLAGAPPAAGPLRPLHLVLVAGPKDHGRGEHDYPAWQKVWAGLLATAEHVTVSTAWEWPSAEQLHKGDVFIFYQKGDWTPQRAKDTDALLARGGGLVYLHFAVYGQKDAPGFAQRIGLAWQDGQSKYRHGPVELDFGNSHHPIARTFGKVRFVDETYWRLTGDPKRLNLVASGMEEGRSWPLFWTLEPDKGRVFVTLFGHYAWTFDDPLFRVLLLRGIAWAAKEPVDRFNALVWPGARVGE